MFCKVFIESNIYVASYLCYTNYDLDDVNDEDETNAIEVEGGIVKSKWSDATTGPYQVHNLSLIIV